MGRFGLVWISVTALALAGCGDATSSSGVITGSVQVTADFGSFHPEVVSLARESYYFTRGATGAVALDTTIQLAAGQERDQRKFTFTLRSAGEQLTLVVALIDDAGDTSFRAGPLQATPPANGTPASVTATFQYVGPGATAQQIRISPSDTVAYYDQSDTLLAGVFDGNGAKLSGVPIGWSTRDTGIVQLTVPAASEAVAKTRTTRGIARVVATLPTGQMDTMRLTAQPRPSVIVAESGDRQTGDSNAALTLPLVARVLGPDSLGVTGVHVDFAITSGDGTLSDDSLRTDADGRASITYTMGTAAAPNVITASSPEVGSTASFSEILGSAVASSVLVVAGDSQGAPVGQPVAVAPRVRVLNASGQPLSGVTVHFRVVSGGGGVSGATPTSDPSGEAAVTQWTLGSADAINSLQADVALWNDTVSATFLAQGYTAGGVGDWTWVSGSTVGDASGSYGTLGAADSSTVPGARREAAAWTDTDGHLWMFGGIGWDQSGQYGDLNDLWEFDGVDWIWRGGSSNANATGVYGSMGVSAASNVPGARHHAAFCRDPAGNLWLFGGWGYGASQPGTLHDLWKFDGTDWTWVAGAGDGDKSASYGSLGVPDASNHPGARFDASCAFDAAGNLWLMGGSGVDANGVTGDLNDLWRFDGSNWTWIAGASFAHAPTQFGSLGVTASSNVPGGRFNTSAWIDGTGGLWVFAGAGYGVESGGLISYSAHLNELWRFDGTYWTWVGGSAIAEAQGDYGSKQVPSPSNIPAARSLVAWTADASGAEWFFGGSMASAPLNDLWKFDGTEWTWVSGSATNGQPPTYGLRGGPSTSNVPGARYGAVMWSGVDGTLWVFGGVGVDGAGSVKYLNDLWRYVP